MRGEVPSLGGQGPEQELFSKMPHLSSQVNTPGPGHCPRTTGVLGLSSQIPQCWCPSAGPGPTGQPCEHGKGLVIMLPPARGPHVAIGRRLCVRSRSTGV